MKLSDVKRLLTIRKKREEYQRELNKLNIQQQKLKKEINKLYPKETIPTMFNSEYGSYQTVMLIEGKLSLNDLPDGVKYEFGCNVNYKGKLENGAVSCVLNPKLVAKQKEFLQIVMDITQIETKIANLNEQEEKFLAKEKNNHQNSNSLI